jgi:hypothetical protein
LSTEPNAPTPNKIYNGFRIKDLSDWLKFILALAAAFMAYQKLSDQVGDHTRQLGTIYRSLEELKTDEAQHNEDEEKVIGKIQLYLSSKDKNYWDKVTQ